MSDRPSFQLTATVLDAPDPAGLASFYRELLGWEIRMEDPTWVALSPPDRVGAGLSFQYEPNYERPTWPATPEDQQMMLHLDIEVDDLESAGARAESLGAELAPFQPQDDVRVYLDPAGHPFCLWIPTED